MNDHSYGRDNDYHCTAWAKFRWRELDFAGNFGTVGGRTGNGWEMASFNGGSAATPPTLGAMASYGDGGANNHVMIVEEIKQDASGHPVIRVSEMNSGIDARNGRPAASGQHAFEYRSTREFTQVSPAGPWNSGKESVEIRFATLPKG